MPPQQHGVNAHPSGAIGVGGGAFGALGGGGGGGGNSGGPGALGVATPMQYLPMQMMEPMAQVDPKP